MMEIGLEAIKYLYKNKLEMISEEATKKSNGFSGHKLYVQKREV